jgi:uncharacterized membrane protein
VDDALRKRLDAVVALLGLAVALLAAIAGATNLAALVGATLAWLVALLGVWIVRPSWERATGDRSD